MARFPYTTEGELPTSLMPRLPMTLSLGQKQLDVVGLLDTGATVNVLPYHVGLALGANWEAQTTPLMLVGSLGEFEARGLFVMAAHPQITQSDSVRLVFAWTRAETAPVIFGQLNFFLEFDVCFYRSLRVFDVQQRSRE